MPGNFSDMQGSGIIFRSCFSPPLSDDNVQSFPFLLFLLLVTLAWALLLTPPLSSFLVLLPRRREERRRRRRRRKGLFKTFFRLAERLSRKEESHSHFFEERKKSAGLKVQHHVWRRRDWRWRDFFADKCKI